MRRKVSVIIPVCNESENIPVVARQVTDVLRTTPYDFEIIFVDDGSSDDSLSVLANLSAQNPEIFFISFSRNFGHQNALKAGLDHARGDAVISMDGDLQHPPALLTTFLKHWEEGYQVVYTKRIDSNSAPLMKRLTGKIFYRVLRALSDVEIESGTADFRLLDRKVVDQLKALPEAGPFYRGLVKWVGFRQISVEYNCAARHSGTTKYTFNKMFHLAIEGVTSFNIKPLMFSIYLGFSFTILSMLVYLPYMIYMLQTRNHFPRWASLISVIVFFGGLNLTILGIIGLYIGKLFVQAKSRPHYIVQKTNLW